MSFRAILYVPPKLCASLLGLLTYADIDIAVIRGDAYWQNPLQTSSKDIRLMVKRVFITSDFGEDTLPKWANWVKVVVDGRLSFYSNCMYA